MTPSREQSRLIVLMLSRENRFRLMFGQPFFDGPDVERYKEAMREYEELPSTDSQQNSLFIKNTEK